MAKNKNRYPSNLSKYNLQYSSHKSKYMSMIIDVVVSYFISIFSNSSNLSITSLSDESGIISRNIYSVAVNVNSLPVTGQMHINGIVKVSCRFQGRIQD